MPWLGSAAGWIFRAWIVCALLALPVFVVLDTRNNWKHGNTGVSGYLHTLTRVGGIAFIAPLFLIMLIRQSLGSWRK